MKGMLLLAMVQWGFLTAVIARGKRRDPARWFVVGAVLPVIGLVIAIAASTPPRRRRLATLRAHRRALRLVPAR